MDVNFDNENATTYNCSYGFKKIFPPLKKFRQIASIELTKAPKLQPRKFPIEPIGPKRHLEAISPHLPNIQLFHDKPIVRAPAPLDFQVEPNLSTGGKPQKYHKPAANISEALPALPEANNVDEYSEEVDKETIDELCSVFRWKSTTRAATEQACLPVIEKPPLRTTLEANADLVMSKPKRYESAPRLWQRVATRWDLPQERSTVPSISTRKMLTAATHTMDKLPCSNNVPIKENTYRLSIDDKLTSTYVRQTPGYAGFVPRTPLEVPMARGRLTADYTPSSTMRSSFRPFPSEMLHRLSHCRRGPLSKTVTLTYPFNPFSKVDQRAFSKNLVDGRSS
ncbi:uncharacterized protein [Antedon mediterranea]|uniref:uncharacterized protein n=1 Tax=Antedon mediterranea TaxID=105859 RepID=UPI003AF46D3D